MNRLLKTIILVLLLVQLCISACLLLIDSVAMWVFRESTYSVEIPQLGTISERCIGREERLLIACALNKIKDGKNVLVFAEYPWFISYYLYPTKLYGVHGDYEPPEDWDSLDSDWLKERNIGWVIISNRSKKDHRIIRLEDVR